MTEYSRSSTLSIALLAIASATLINGTSEPNVEVLVNDSANITCLANKSIDVQWRHTPLDGSRKIFFAGGNFYFHYGERFKMDNPKHGVYVLIIQGAIPDDAGLYECGEDQTTILYGFTNLTVIDPRPVCTSNMKPDGFVGQNNCSLQQENMTFTCAVSFIGNSDPNLTWRSLGNNHILNDSFCVYQPKRTICSLTLRADAKFDRSVLICETTTSTGSRYNCTSEVIKVQYFLAGYGIAKGKVHENVSCNVESNLDIRYNWTLEQDGKDIILSTNKTTVAQKPGIYQCQVEYSIRNITCSTLVSSVNISLIQAEEGSATDDGSTYRAMIIAIVVTLGLCLAVVVPAVVIVYMKRTKKISFKKSEKATESETLPLTEVVKSDAQKLHTTISKYREKLEKLVESEFGFLDNLVIKEIVTSDDNKKIETENGTVNKNKMLLNIIMKNEKHQEFVDALQSFNQCHVAAWIKYNGEYDEKIGLDWPLMDREEAIINSNYKQLKDTLSNEDGFLEMLLKKEVINVRQKEFISSKKTMLKRNEAFLDILSRFSLKAFHLVTECLIESKQAKIAEIFDKGGVITPVHVTLGRDNTTDVEEKILKEIKYVILQNKTFENETDIRPLMNELSLSIVAAKQGNSIVLFTRSQQKDEFDSLYTLVKSEKTRIGLQELFNLLLGKTQAVIVQTVKINEKDAKNAQKSFQQEVDRDKKLDEHFRRLRSKVKPPSMQITENKSDKSVSSKPSSPGCSKPASPQSSVKSVTNPTTESEPEKVDLTDHTQDLATSITEDNWRQILRSNYADLLVGIECSDGLEGQFLKLRLFTKIQINNIWGQKSSIERNKAILSLLEKGDLKRFNAFREALKDAGHQPQVEQHLTFIKDHSSNNCTKYNKPLQQSYRYLLLIHWNELLENLMTNINNIMVNLKTRGTFTAYQEAVIKNLRDTTSKTTYLLRLMETGSQQHFDDLCECLNDIQCSHIVAQFLTPKSINSDLDFIPRSFKDCKIVGLINSSRRPKTGQMIILSNRYYKDEKLWNRSEMQQNLMNLNIVFQDKFKPAFESKTIENKTAENLKDELKSETKKVKGCDVFLMFIFSYGINGELFTVDGQSLQIDDIFSMFDGENCPVLNGKPKLFIIQTFRLKPGEEPTADSQGLSGEPECDADGQLSIKFKLRDDMAIIYGTTKGEPENGREETGTLFIRCFLHVFCSEVHQLDFKSMMEKVQELLAKTDQKISDTETVRQLSTFACNIDGKFNFLT